MDGKSMTTILELLRLRVRRTCLFVILLFMAGCSSGRVSIPRPNDPLLPPPPLPIAEPSVVRLDVVIPVADLQRAAENAFPATIEQDEWRDAGSAPLLGRAEYRYRIERGPLNVSVARNENGLRIRIPDMRLALMVLWHPPIGEPVDLSCGDGAPVRLSVSAVTRLSWSQDWALQTDTVFESVELLDACYFARVNLDVASLIQKALDSRLDELATVVDEKVKEQSAIRDLVERLWTRMGEPLLLGDGLWLSMRPVAVSAADPEIDNDRLAATLAITFDPDVSTGARPAVVKRPLPRLAVEPVLPDSIHITLPVRTTWVEITERLSSELKGRTIDLMESKSMTIEDLEVYGSGNRVIVRVGVSGDVAGDLYVAGIPAIEQGTSTFFLREPDFTIDTQSQLAKYASAFARRSILEAIEKSTRVDLRPRLEEIRARVADAMSQRLDSGWRLDGTVTGLQTREIYPTVGGVEIRVVLDGTLEVRPE